MSLLIHRLRELIACERGNVLITWAVLMPVMTGMMGLGLETGMWYLTKRNLQSAADAAAIAAAYETTAQARTTSAQASLAANGFSSVSASVNNPPTTGTYTSNGSAVEIVLSQPQSLLFSGMFLSQQPAVTARAVGLRSVPPGSGGGCILALATSGTSINMNGGAVVNASSCFAAANSNNNEALKMNGGASLSVLSFYSMGDYRLSGGATLYTTNAPTVNAATAISDPYANVAIPSYSGCNHTAYSLNSGQSANLSPGVYCNGFSINGGASATLSPGTYIMDRGSFSINGNATLTGTGVTIILTSSTGSSYATISINGGANVNLSAPTSGSLSGLAFYQDRNAPAGISGSFNGGSTMTINGALYLPRGQLSFNGGNSIQNPSCTQLIGWTLDFNGGSNLTGTCQNSGMTPISLPGTGTVSLVE